MVLAGSGLDLKETPKNMALVRLLWCGAFVAATSSSVAARPLQTLRRSFPISLRSTSGRMDLNTALSSRRSSRTGSFPRSPRRSRAPAAPRARTSSSTASPRSPGGRVVHRCAWMWPAPSAAWPAVFWYPDSYQQQAEHRRGWQRDAHLPVQGLKGSRQAVRHCRRFGQDAFEAACWRMARTSGAPVDPGCHLRISRVCFRRSAPMPFLVPHRNDALVIRRAVRRCRSIARVHVRAGARPIAASSRSPTWTG